MSALQQYRDGQILLVDKPAGWTSFDVVNKIRHVLGGIKTGHAGTLDPMATGLLIVATGRFTKKLSEFMHLDKTYTGIIRLGATTPSYDADTPPEAYYDVHGITVSDIEAAVRVLTGTIQQVPPPFSAIKKGGRPAYMAARQGKPISLEPRIVTIKRFQIDRIDMPDLYFTIECSKGTYIRSLAHDLGKLLRNGAYLISLRRTAIGPYHVEEAWPLPQLVEQIKQQILSNKK